MKCGRKRSAHAAGVALDLFIFILPFLLCSLEKEHTSVSAFSVIPCELRMIISQIACAWIWPLNSK